MARSQVVYQAAWARPYRGRPSTNAQLHNRDMLRWSSDPLSLRDVLPEPMIPGKPQQLRTGFTFGVIPSWGKGCDLDERVQRMDQLATKA